MSKRYDRDYDRDRYNRQDEEERERYSGGQNRREEEGYGNRSRNDEMRSWGDDEAMRRRNEAMRTGQGSSNMGNDYDRDYRRGYGRGSAMNEWGRESGGDSGRDTGYGRGGYGREYGNEYNRNYERDYNRERDFGGRDFNRENERNHGGRETWQMSQGRTQGMGPYNRWGEDDYRQNFGENYGRQSGQSDWNQNRGYQPGYSQQQNYNPQGYTPQGSEYQRYSGRGPRNYKRTDDRISEDIHQQLTHHPEIDAYEIEVKVMNGEVTLTGTVEDRSQKRQAEDVVEDVWGVKEVHNQIRVKSRQDSREGRKDKSKEAA